MSRAVFNTVVLGAILVMGVHLGIFTFRRAEVRGDLRVVGLEARELYDAFERYRQRNGAYPQSYADPAFSADTLEPFRRRGYYDGGILTKLKRGEADAYGSPDDRGPDQEFWLEMTLAADPEIRILIARSDDAPMSGGRWCEGVFVFTHGELKPL